MAVGPGARLPVVRRPRVRAFHVGEAAFDQGVEEHRADGVVVRLYAALQTAVDCLRLKDEVGVDADCGDLNPVLQPVDTAQPAARVPVPTPRTTQHMSTTQPRRMPRNLRRSAVHPALYTMLVACAGGVGCRGDSGVVPAQFRQLAMASFDEDLAAAPTATVSAAREPEEAVADPVADLPGGEWWDDEPGLVFGGTSRSLGLSDVFGSALRNSNQIRVFSDLPLIRDTSVAEAEGLFAARLFAEGKYENLNEPVGSTLQTGGPDRFREESVVGEIGVTKRLRTGGDVTVSQRVENVDNNSVFFVPDPQSRAKLVVGVVQPLLRGGGVGYNTSIIEIARIDGQVARNELIRQVESHLSEVSRAYWNLYLARATYRQQAKLAESTQEVVRRLQGREQLDASGRLLLRARSEQSRRQSDLVRSEAAIRNAEDRLRSLLNDAELYADAIELIPTSPGVAVEPPDELEVDVEAALADRPEVRQARLQLEAAGIRESMAKHETRPRLDLIAEAHVAGLDGGDDVGDPLGNQFSEGGVSYAVGLRFEMPLGGSSEKARFRRRRVERLQQATQLAVTLDTIELEARISAREVRTAYREVEARRRSLRDAREDLQLVSDRFERGLGRDGDNGVAASFLEFLLDAQERVARAEGEYAEAVAGYQVSLVNLERVKGALLRYEEVDAAPSLRENARDNLPAIEVR